MRRLLKVFNKLLIVPLFRLGLGRFVCNPATGYYMVVRTVGRKTGRLRYAPVTYAVANGCVYCLAGYGGVADWYRNAIASHTIRLILPGRRIVGNVEEVEDAAERLTMIRQIFRNAGMMGFTEGFDPFRASDDSLQAKTAAMPVLRIRPTGAAIAGGAFDPGGRAWLWAPAFAIVLVMVVAVLDSWGRA